MISMAIWFFLSFLPIVSNSLALSLRGLATKVIMRCLWFLFALCFNAREAIWIALDRFESPWTSSLLIRARMVLFSWTGVRRTW